MTTVPINRTLRLRRLATIGALTLVWCGLWGNISAANLLAGLALAIAITASGVGTPGSGSIRPWPLAKLVGVVAVDLVKSTVNVAAEIITPVDSTDEAVIAVDVPLPTRDHLLLLVVAVTLTPGTAVVDADPQTGTLYLHLLHDKRRAETVEHIHQLAELACAALPTTEGALS